MAVRTLRRKATPTELRELFPLLESTGTGASPLRIENGVIYGVKVLGRNSPNGHAMPGAERTEYTDAAMRAALPLYEGADVICDHPDRKTPNAERSTADALGVLRNCRVTPDGIRGDLHYYESHPFTPRLLEDIRRQIGRFGLSHNALGRGQVREGTYVIEQILEVRSVDLVLNAATNTNLWESRAVATKKKTTLKAFLEGLAPKFDQARRDRVKQLLEMGDGACATAMEIDEPPSPAEPAAADPDEALWSGFSAAIQACLSKYQAGELDAAGVVKEIGRYIKTHEKLGSDGGTAVEEGEDEGYEDKETKESKDTAQRLAELERKDACRDLCESLQFAPTKDQLAALMEMATPAARKTAAEAFKAAGGTTPARTVQKTKSAPPPAGGGTANTVESKIPAEAPELANWLRG